MTEQTGDQVAYWERSVELGEEGQRIDRYLATVCEEVTSRSQAQMWIKEGRLLVNDGPTKANYTLALGDRLMLSIPAVQPVQWQAEAIDLEVVYEDTDLIVINKPRGMVVHPAAGHDTGTLVHALMHHCQDLSGINGEMRPGIVHRIDKDTSGLLVAAKNDQAHLHLSEQLKAHTVIRRYMGVVHGMMSHLEGTVDAPIGRHPNDRKKYTVTDKNSKHAVTHFELIEQFRDAALLELRLETGRTHQIRVHMKFIEHPLVGDPVYGSSKASRSVTMEGQALHAAVLGFVHPRSGEELLFTAPLPDDMNVLIDRLKNV